MTVPVLAQNAPYHHVRGVKSLSSIDTKADMMKLINETLVNPPIPAVAPITQLTLPAKEGTREQAVSVPIAEIAADIAAKKKATPNRPRVPSGPELKEAWLTTMQNHPSEAMRKLLGCKLEQYLVDELGAEFLWTPPYTPTLQPIEEFWGGGKNYVASLYANTRRIKEVVQQLRIGWYGDGDEKQPLPCDRLVAHTIADADRRMKEVGGLTGSMETGVTVVEGTKVITDTAGKVAPLPNDMQTMQQTLPEPVDLTCDDPAESAAGETAQEPLVLDEDEHLAAAATALAEGTAEVVSPDEESAPATTAPPDSPAAAATSRRRESSRRPGGAARQL